MPSICDSVKRAGRVTAACLKILIVLLALGICLQIATIVFVALSRESEQPLTTWGSLPACQSVLVSHFEGTNGQMVAQYTANALSQAILLAMLILAAAIFTDAAKCYTPFSSKQSTRLKIISLLTLALALLPSPIKMLLTMVLSPDSKATAEFQLTLVLLTVIFYTLSQVFDYGSMLQKQSDETL